MSLLMDPINQVEAVEAPENNVAQNAVVPMDGEVKDETTHDVQTTPKSVLANYLRSSRLALRGYILGQIVAGEHIEDTYEDLCKAVQDPNLDYIAFEEEFMRLSNGEPLDFKPRDKTKDKTLEDLPQLAFNVICKNLDWNVVQSTRQVSSTIRNLVDSQSSDIEMSHLFIDYVDDEFAIDYGHDSFKLYQTAGVNECVVTRTSKSFLGWSQNPNPPKSISQDMVEKVSKDVLSFLNNKRIRIKLFQIQLLNWRQENDADVERLINIIRTARSDDENLLRVETVKLQNVQNTNLLIDLLSLFRPGTLKEIYLNFRSATVCDLTNVIRLPQWMSAVKFKALVGLIPPEQVHYTYHFENVTFSSMLPHEKVQEVIEAFELSPNTKQFRIILPPDHPVNFCEILARKYQIDPSLFWLQEFGPMEITTSGQKLFDVIIFVNYYFSFRAIPYPDYMRLRQNNVIRLTHPSQ